jgi:tRNA(Ile)-lysidine synthase
VSFSADVLRTVLEAHAPVDATGLVVALSGSMDSACLATALSLLLPAPFRQLPVRALHVDHGLQPAAINFRIACSELCAKLAIPLEIIVVHVECAPGESIEAAARAARYRALAQALRPGECLMTAHHEEDQAETVLLQLLRGAGLKGMSAMPICRSLGAGSHLRPLLDVKKRDLVRFAAAHAIESVADPMNQDMRFDRGYLRAQVWPLIAARWPGAAVALSRTALHVADAQALLDQSAAAVVQKLLDGDALSVTGLRVLPDVERLNALRHWIASHSVPLPSTARLTEALRQIIEAEADHLPVVVWAGHALRRYRDRVFLTAATVPRVVDLEAWHVVPGSVLRLGDGLGTLRWSAQEGGLNAARLPAHVSVRRRRGGESLKPREVARGVQIVPTRTVQHLCQSVGVLPWMRQALPLIYAGGNLVAIGDLWQDARWCVPRDAAGLGVVWDDAPVLI